MALEVHAMIKGFKQHDQVQRFTPLKWDLNLVDGNVLFIDTLVSFYLRLYGVGHIIKDHLDSERKTYCSYFMDYSF